MFKISEAGGSTRTRSRDGARVVVSMLIAMLVTVYSCCASAQTNTSWIPTHPSTDTTQDQTKNDENTLGRQLKGSPMPKGCDTKKPKDQQLIAVCVMTATGYFWRWYDFNTYACQGREKLWRTIEYYRETDIPCKKSSWAVTLKMGTDWGEDWQPVNIGEPLEQSGAKDDPGSPPGDRPQGVPEKVSKLDKDGKVVEEKKETKTSSGGGENKTDKKPRKTTRRSHMQKSHTTASRTQPKTQPSNTGIPITIGIGIGTRHGGGEHGERGDGR
jgi:hypothetical protein